MKFCAGVERGKIFPMVTHAGGRGGRERVRIGEDGKARGLWEESRGKRVRQEMEGWETRLAGDCIIDLVEIDAPDL